MCSVPQLILKHLISSVVSLSQLVSSCVALLAELFQFVVGVVAIVVLLMVMVMAATCCGFFCCC